MNTAHLNTSRFIVGIVLVLVAAGLFVFSDGDSFPTGAIAIGILGIVAIAISRKN